MVNINKLKAKMVENEISVSQLADRVGVNQATMYRRFNGGENFSIKEASEIAKILNLSADELNDIFFNEIVAEMQQ